MQIDKILYQLLLQHECVIVPNFGGFIVRESPCNFNNSKDTLKPFVKTVFFNPHLIENDGLLLNAIVKSKNISYAEALVVLEKWIDLMNKNILEIGKSNIHQIGVFQKGNDNGKWFTADPFLNLELSTYGLRPVNSKIVNEAISEVVLNEIKLKPLADNKPIEKFELPKTNWKAWAAAAAIALIAHIGYLSFENKGHAVHEASIVPSISNTDVKAVDSLISENTTEEVLPEVNLTEQTPTEMNTPVEEQASELEVRNETEVVIPEPQPIIIETPITEIQQEIVAKYRLEQNAIYHQKDFSKANINSIIQKNKEGLFEVIITPNKSF